MVDATAVAMAFFRPIRDHQNRISDFQALEVNQAYALLLQRPPDELLRRTLTEHGFPASVSELTGALVRVAETGQPFQTGFAHPVDGRPCWLSLRAVWQGDGLVLSYEDLSPMQQEHPVFGRMFDASPVSMMVLEPIPGPGGVVDDFRVLFSNQATSILFGWSLEYLLDGGPLGQKLPQYRRFRLFDLFAQVAGNRQSARREFQYDGDGIHRWLDVSAWPQGRNGVVAMIMDATPIRQARLDAQKAVRELTFAREQAQEMIHMVSHDLQEPLRKIQLFGKALSLQPALVEDSGNRELINRIQSAAARMSNLVADLLTYSRILNRTETFQRVSLDGLLGRITEDLRNADILAEAVIHTTELPEVAGDSAQLYQLFYQLLSNAVKFRKGDVPCQVWISGRRIHKGELDPSITSDRFTDPPETLWEIRVVDNGIGFDEKYRDRIFQVFRRLHGKSQYAGSGLGLSICRKVVDNHGGAITARSEPNRGTTFLVYLPA